MTSQHPDVDLSQTWFHGSPQKLEELLPGSTITQDRTLALVFSHKPSLVSDTRDEGAGGSIKHNGRADGWLHVVDEPVRSSDIVPVPGSTIGPGQEWQTTRPLRVVAVERTRVSRAELLSAEEESSLLRRASESSFREGRN